MSSDVSGSRRLLGRASTAGWLAMVFIVALLALASVWTRASSTAGFLGTETGSSHGVVLATHDDTSPATSPEFRTANAVPSDLRAPAAGATVKAFRRSIAFAVAKETGGAASVRLWRAGAAVVRGVYDIGPQATAEIGGGLGFSTA